MGYGSIVQMFFDEATPIMQNLDYMSAEEVKEWFKKSSELFFKAKKEFLDIIDEINIIRDRDLNIDEKLRLLDERADRLDYINFGRHKAEESCRDRFASLWDKLDSRSKEFLITAFVIETSIDDSHADFAPEVIEIGRVFENELQKKVYIDYINTISQRNPALTDSDDYYRDIENAVNNHRNNRAYFISATKMMKYIGRLRETSQENSRVFRKELRQFLTRRSSNIPVLSNETKVRAACDYIDEYRNKAAHPNTADTPNNFDDHRVEQCKIETQNVLDYFLSNVGGTV